MCVVVPLVVIVIVGGQSKASFRLSGVTTLRTFLVGCSGLFGLWFRAFLRRRCELTLGRGGPRLLISRFLGRFFLGQRRLGLLRVSLLHLGKLLLEFALVDFDLRFLPHHVYLSLFVLFADSLSLLPHLLLFLKFLVHFLAVLVFSESSDLLLNLDPLFEARSLLLRGSFRAQLLRRLVDYHGSIAALSIALSHREDRGLAILKLERLL